MKPILLLLCAVIVTCTALTEQQIEKMRQVRLQCLKEVGLTEEEHRRYVSDRSLINNPKVKQQILCTFKKVGYMAEDGDVNTDFLKQRLMTVISEDKAEDIVKKCAVKKETPEETGLNLMLCLIDNGPRFSPYD